MRRIFLASGVVLILSMGPILTVEAQLPPWMKVHTDENITKLLPPVFVRIENGQQQSVGYSRLFTNALLQGPSVDPPFPVAVSAGLGELHVQGVDSLHTYRLETEHGVPIATERALFSDGPSPAEVVFKGVVIGPPAELTLVDENTGQEILLSLPVPDPVLEADAPVALPSSSLSNVPEDSRSYYWWKDGLGEWWPYARYDAVNPEIIGMNVSNPGTFQVGATSPSGCTYYGEVHYTGEYAEPYTWTEVVLTELAHPGDPTNPEWQLIYWMPYGQPIQRSQIEAEPWNQDLQPNSFKSTVLSSIAPQNHYYFTPLTREIDWIPYNDNVGFWAAAIATGTAAKYVAYTTNIGQFFHIALDTSGSYYARTVLSDDGGCVPVGGFDYYKVAHSVQEPTIFVEAHPDIIIEFMGTPDGSNGGGIAMSSGQSSATMYGYFADAMLQVVADLIPKWLTIPLNVGVSYVIDEFGSQQEMFEPIGELAIGNEQVLDGLGVRFRETSAIAKTYGASFFIDVVHAGRETTFNVWDQEKIVIEVQEAPNPLYAVPYTDGVVFEVSSKMEVRVYRPLVSAT